jgi:anti-anti-sigma factor
VTGWTDLLEEIMTVLDVGLQISEFRVDGVTVVVLRGEIDAGNASALRAAFDTLDPDDHVYVDCADVGFIDGAGLCALSEAAERNVTAGGPLHVHASPALRRIVEISDMEHLFAFD